MAVNGYVELGLIRAGEDRCLTGEDCAVLSGQRSRELETAQDSEDLVQQVG